MNLREQSFLALVDEAKNRGISIQQLLRAVIIPEWMRVNGRVTRQNASSANASPLSNPASGLRIPTGNPIPITNQYRRSNAKEWFKGY